MTGLTDALEKLISSRTVIGQPIALGEVTLVPVVDVTFGFGSGAGSPPREAEKESHIVGTGIVSGARICPRAVIVVRADQVDIYPLSSSSGPIERILDKIPSVASSIIDRIKDAAQRPEATDECTES